MSRITAIILAAGRGTRMQGRTPKQFLGILGKPVAIRAIEAFLPVADTVMVVTGEKEVQKLSRLVLEYKLEGKVFFAVGGNERYESAINGLQAVRALHKEQGIPERETDEGIVLIHDAARCLVTEKIIRACIADAEQYGSGVAAIPMKDTVKVAKDGAVLSTPDRRTLYSVQTPQGFRQKLIETAYENAKKAGKCESLTDDASAVEQFTDVTVHLSEGSDENLKITTPTDLIFAEAIIRARMN